MADFEDDPFEQQGSPAAGEDNRDLPASDDSDENGAFMEDGEEQGEDDDDDEDEDEDDDDDDEVETLRPKKKRARGVATYVLDAAEEAGEDDEEEDEDEEAEIGFKEAEAEAFRRKDRTLKKRQEAGLQAELGM